MPKTQSAADAAAETPSAAHEAQPDSAPAAAPGAEPPAAVPSDPMLALAEPDEDGRVAIVIDRGGIVQRVDPEIAAARIAEREARPATLRDLAIAGVA